MPKFADPDTEAPDRESGLKFFKMEDLIGRNVIIVPKSIETKQGTFERDGKPPSSYESITADLIVLDGRKTEKIPELPRIERDFWVTGYNVVAELRQFVGKGQPVIGYLATSGKAYVLDKAEKAVQEAKSTEAAWEEYEKGGSTQKEEPPF